MTEILASTPAERFRELIAERLGLQFEDAKLNFLAEILRRRSRGERSEEGYLDRLAVGGAGDELDALALELTVPETYFFRNIEQFHALAEAVLPQLARGAGGAPLRVLSAGCASGEEPYTMAMIGREAPAGLALDIRAADINAAMLAKAARGRYTEWALRETPAEMRGRWFRRKGSEWMLDESIRNAVQFVHCNLVEENAAILAPASCDVVFCRNMLMYLTPPKAAALIARIAQALVPGGYLFLGHAETLRGLSHDFDLHHTHGTFYYRRRVGAADEAAEGGLREDAGLPAALRDAVAGAPGNWMEIIGAASERVGELTRTALLAADAPPAPPRGAESVPAGGAESVLELLRRERYADALALLQSPARPGMRSDEERLLAAVLLAQAGRLTEAEAACRHLLEADGLNDGAHYVLALCREGAGDGIGAAEHHQTAAYLDPAFAMPRLHLGLLARRAGDLAAARRELTQAIALLRGEGASRLLLFGGGFGRAALLALATAELVSCGGAA
ncbi:MAG TPA: protein-glutamate O-methyltransferase CheR [Burkholderiales bacterium]